MTAVQDAPAVPASIADRAALLRPCPGCGALPAACLETLLGLRQRPCCPACDHYPELPHRPANEPHDPARCAAWARAQGVPPNVACPTHWEPLAVREWREQFLADYRAEQARRGRGPYAEAELVPPARLHREDHRG